VTTQNTVASTGAPIVGAAARAAQRLIIGLVALQLVQGVLGAFYTPLLTPMARNVGMRDADWNWFDSALAAVAALALPLLTKLGDVIGHRKVLIGTTFVVAASSWLAVIATDFWTLFAAFALQGFIAVWYPFQLALLRDATPPEHAENRVAKVTSALTAVFMVGSVLATALGGQLFTMNGGWDALQTGLDAGIVPAEIVGFRESLIAVLLIPAIVSTLAIPIVWLLIPKPVRGETPAEGVGQLGFAGLIALGGISIGIVVGFGLVKLGGIGLVPGWIVVAASVLAIVPFLRWQAVTREPAIDVAALRDRSRGPYMIATIFFTIVYSTATVPTVTFFSTDRDTYGYGISASPSDISVIMLAMIGAVIIVASITTRISSSTTRLWTLRIAPLFFALEYTWLFLFHDTLWQAVVTAVIGGIGAGVLVPGIPAAVAVAARAGRVAADIGVLNVLSILGATAGSAVFALALHDTADSTVTAAPLAGYMTVWGVTIALSIALAAILWSARSPQVETTIEGKH